MTLTAALANDADLVRRVRTYLAGRNLPALRNLRVEARDGVVTLSGRLRTFYEKQVAISSCRRVAGVLALHDAVDVA